MRRGTPLLVLTELFLPTKGGTAVWFAEVYRRLGGKEIHIVTADVPGAAEVDAVHPNTVHRLDLRRIPWLKPESLAMYARLFMRGLRVVLRQHCLAVHAGRVLPEGWVGWWVARIARVPLVIYAHGEEITTWRQPAKFKAMRWAYRHADQVIANSEFTRDELLKLGLDPRRIVLISPGVDSERFRPDLPHDDLRARIGITQAQPLILSVGRLSRRKGFDQVVKVLPELVARGIDVHYAVIGIGEDRTYLSSLAEERGVAARVHLLGHVPMDELPRWYNAAEVFAMPNREIDGDTEGFGMVFLEAAACAKPAIAGRAGGTAAAVVHELTGLRVDGADAPEVAAALARLLSDRTYATTLGRNGYTRVQAQGSWEAVAEKTRTLIIE